MIQTGDKLMWRQWESSNTNAGIIMGFTDGLQNWSPGVNLTDQHGEGLHTSAILGWNYRFPERCLRTSGRLTPKSTSLTLNPGKKHSETAQVIGFRSPHKER